MRSQHVPPIAELRATAQGAKIAADRRWWYVAFRKVSIYVTWALLHTRATPNQVTVASLLVAATGIVVIASPNAWAALGGYVLLLIYHLLDRVDGEIARVRNTHSLHGIYLDNAGHYLTAAGVFVGTSYRLALEAGAAQWWWLLGVGAGIAALMARMEKHAAFHLFSQYVLERPELARAIEPSTEGALTRASTREGRAAHDAARSRTPIEVARDLALTVTSFPAVTALLGVATVAEAASSEQAITQGAFVVLCSAQILTYLALEAVMLRQGLAAEVNRMLDDLEER